MNVESTDKALCAIANALCSIAASLDSLVFLYATGPEAGKNARYEYDSTAVKRLMVALEAVAGSEEEGGD